MGNDQVFSGLKTGVV